MPIRSKASSPPSAIAPCAPGAPCRLVVENRKADGLHPHTRGIKDMAPPQQGKSGATRHPGRQIHRWGRQQQSRQNQRRMIRPRHPKSGIARRSVPQTTASQDRTRSPTNRASPTPCGSRASSWCGRSAASVCSCRPATTLVSLSEPLIAFAQQSRIELTGRAIY